MIRFGRNISKANTAAAKPAGRILPAFALLLGICLAGPSVAYAEDVSTYLAEQKIAAEKCVEQNRDICVISVATGILSSSKYLEPLMANDPLLVDWYVRVFTKASYNTASVGRPSFRKFMSENADWALALHNELRRFLGYEKMGTRETEISLAGFNLQRAIACEEMEVRHCTVAAARGVYNAVRREYWDYTVERFEIQDELASEIPMELIARYESEF